MIYEPRVGRTVVDREFLATATGRSEHTIRARCTTIGYSRDGRALYDLDDATAILDTLAVRTRHTLAEPANAV